MKKKKEEELIYIRLFRKPLCLLFFFLTFIISFFVPNKKQDKVKINIKSLKSKYNNLVKREETLKLKKRELIKKRNNKIDIPLKNKNIPFKKNSVLIPNHITKNSKTVKKEKLQKNSKKAKLQKNIKNFKKRNINNYHNLKLVKKGILNDYQDLKIIDKETLQKIVEKEILNNQTSKTKEVKNKSNIIINKKAIQKIDKIKLIKKNEPTLKKEQIIKFIDLKITKKDITNQTKLFKSLLELQSFNMIKSTVNLLYYYKVNLLNHQFKGSSIRTLIDSIMFNNATRLASINITKDYDIKLLDINKIKKDKIESTTTNLIDDSLNRLREIKKYLINNYPIYYFREELKESIEKIDFLEENLLYNINGYSKKLKR
ncbi:MAG: hypothetical protein RSB77_01235 [Bacilli bacterium]